MKYIYKIAIALIFSLTFFACSENLQDEQVSLVDNSENISKLITSFDVTLKASLNNKNLSNQELGNLFIEKSKNQGLTIIEVNSYKKKGEINSKFSDQYLLFSDKIKNASNFNTKAEFKSSLLDLNNNVLISDLSIQEKQLLIDNIGIMSAFIDWMETLKLSKSFKSNLASKVEDQCDGWWSCWGKCVAGTIGGALEGGIAGCGVGAAVGASVGALGGPVTVAGGAVGGCAAGGVVGIIGGGLSGAASSCD